MKAAFHFKPSALLGALALVGLASGLAAPASPGSASLRLIWVNESHYSSGQIIPTSTPIPREDYAGMSADGTVLIGTAAASSFFQGLSDIGSEAFRRVGDTREKLGFPPDSSTFRRTQAGGISSDGRVVVGSSGNWTLSVAGSPAPGPEAFRWTAETGMQRLFTPRLPMSVAMAASWDGSVVVGSYDLADSRRRAYRWTQGGVTQLEPLPGDAMAEAFGVSGDGSVTVGSSGDVNGFHACHWTNGRSAVNLGFLSGIEHVSEARAISADGKVIVGALGDRRKKQLAFRWTADGGMRALGDISPAASTAVSADGSVIVGASNGEAFRWDARHGKQALAELLTAAGIDLDDLRLDSAIAVSTDGSTILGTGTYPLRGPQLAFGWVTPRTVVWLAHLPTVPDGPAADIPSKYLPESPTETPPDVTLPAIEPPGLGKRKITARNSRVFASGGAQGKVTEVTYRIGNNGPFKPAIGTNLWRFTARLNPGRNAVTIVAHGPGGDSEPIKAAVMRK